MGPWDVGSQHLVQASGQPASSKYTIVLLHCEQTGIGEVGQLAPGHTSNTFRGWWAQLESGPQLWLHSSPADPTHDITECSLEQNPGVQAAHHQYDSCKARHMAPAAGSHLRQGGDSWTQASHAHGACLDSQPHYQLRAPDSSILSELGSPRPAAPDSTLSTSNVPRSLMPRACT